MTSNPRRPVWPLALAGLAIVGVYAYWTIEVEPTPKSNRPTGGLAEIEALAGRTDTNILFIVVDTLRAERMSAYGYARDTTPFLTKLATSGIRFGRNIAQSSWTKSSMASMWSARTPLHVGVTRFDDTIDPKVEMPAEILAAAGFKTVGLFRNGWVNTTFGFDQGFEKYYRPLGAARDPRIVQLRPNADFASNDESVVADAIEFLRIHGETSRWFLYLHLMDVHEYTYDDQSALFGNAVSDLYDNSILREDWIISTLHDYLGKRGLLDETIVVILSDHGEAFGERGYEGHARELFPETTETPVIISLPFALDPGIVLTTKTDNMDIWPTLLELIGIQHPDDDIDGRSRVDAILAAARGSEIPSESLDETSVAYLDENWGSPNSEPHPAVSVVEGKFRYVKGTRWSGKSFEVLLSTDDQQRTNVLAANPEVADSLRAKADAVLDQKSLFDGKQVELDRMQLDQLRALGYQLP